MKLYSHNQAAYEAVMKHYNAGNKRACVIQPTGTGKSYVLAAVAEHFNNVYVIAPNEHVLKQAASACNKNITCQTYSLISSDNYNTPTDINLIVFDEMHRMGASTWSVGCECLMQANPNACILGLTATPIRALEQRDMSEEYFKGHVVSNMTLTDAWCKKVLKTPQKYVIGLTSMDNIQRDRIDKINNSKFLNDEQKKLASAKVINLCRDWSLSNGVPRIINKYWDSKIKKCIVFAPTIYAANNLEPTIRQWYNDAGYPVNKVYVVHNEDINAAESIQEFENNDEGLNILISVSMLNEGIHPKDVSAVILLRATISKNIYMQQIGRCFSVDQEVAPIIFDFADNLTSANSYDEIYKARERVLREGGYIDEKDDSVMDRHQELDTFQIIDTIKTTRELMTEIDKSTKPIDEVFSEVIKFIKINKRLPRKIRTVSLKNMTEEQKTEHKLALFLSKHRNEERVINLRIKYGDFRDYPEKEKQRIILEWCKLNNTFPIGSRTDSDKNRYADYIERCKDSKFLQILRDKYGYKTYLERLEDKRQELIDFCKINNRIPQYNSEDYVEKRLRGYYEQCTKKRLPFAEELRAKYSAIKQLRKGEITREEIIEEVINFIITNKRLPSSGGKGCIKGESRLKSRMKKVRDDERVRNVIEQYTRRRKLYHNSDAQDITGIRIQQLREFVKQHGYLPAHQKGGLEQVLANYFNKGRKTRDIPEVIEIYTNYPAFPQFKARQNYLNMLDFVRKSGKPSPKTHRSIWELYNDHKNDEEVKAALQEYLNTTN